MQAQITDETLLQQIMQHNTEALAALYDRYAQTVYQLILRIVREPAVADELLQETFWQVWQKAEQFQERGSAAAWLCRIARNMSLDELRRQKARPQSLALSEQEYEAAFANRADQSRRVEEAVDHAWTHQRLRQALEQLPAEQRLCLELAYFQGMSQREIAAHLDTPVGTVKTRVRLGMEKLEHLLRLVGPVADAADAAR